MALTASLWNGQPVNPDVLIRAFNLGIKPAPAGPAWRLSHITYGHGIPRLTARFRGNGAPDYVTWVSTGGLELPVQVMGAEAGLDVNTGSYYTPTEKPGPWTLRIPEAADLVSGIGMAIGIQPQPSAQEDNRYLLPILTFTWSDGGTPQPPPGPGNPNVTRADLLALRNRAEDDIRLIDRLLEGTP